MQYYGTRLSENISRREPEGYLLCLNVPVARTGTQEYLPEELGLSGREKLIPVYRPEEEVFSPETIASFEGMPVTNDHPPNGVDSGNIRALQKGHAHNVRRGKGNESDLLLADLMITDPVLIGQIMDGKREISCGYTYELCREKGQYIQRKIRGNHVAVVVAGRAGSRVSIKDNKPERRKNTMKKSLSRILARMAKDGDIETVAEIIEEMLDPETAVEAADAEVMETVEPEEKQEAETPAVTLAVDADTLGKVMSRLDQIITLLTPAADAAVSGKDAEETADPAEEAVDAVTAGDESGKEEETEETAAGEESEEEPVTVETEEDEDPDLLEDDESSCEQEVIPAQDVLRTALRAIGPAIAGLPKKEQRRICEDVAARLHVQPGRIAGDDGIYAAIASGRTKDPAANAADLGKRIMAKRNPNYRKERKE
ncbi:DUF2213 domain-containing protein [Clostridiales bacterium FE2010]|nr:DUF2213 domain-containing protein [Clostridiales bacterium FE2010]